MCELLVAHPQFNYAQNIVAFVTPQLCSGIPQLRAIVLKNLQALLKSDKRGQFVNVYWILYYMVDHLNKSNVCVL